MEKTLISQLIKISESGQIFTLDAIEGPVTFDFKFTEYKDSYGTHGFTQEATHVQVKILVKQNSPVRIPGTSPTRPLEDKVIVTLSGEILLVESALFGILGDYRVQQVMNY